MSFTADPIKHRADCHRHEPYETTGALGDALIRCRSCARFVMLASLSHAAQRRGALSAAVNARRRVPCRVPGHGAAWTSEAYEERAEASEACQACPILDPCRAAGQFERFGVWGGRDVTVKPGKKLPPKSRPTKPRPALDPIACHGCGEMFTPSRTGHTYCRQACRTRLASAERRRRAKENA